MVSYNVFFTPNAGIREERVIAVAHAFLQKLQTEKQICSYRILRVTNPASFLALPQFQAIVDFDTQDALDASFAIMRRPQMKETGPHGELMELVTNFKVSFTTDV